MRCWNRPLSHVAAFVALALTSATRTASAQAVRGRVYNVVTHQGVADVEVALWRGEVPLSSTRTDSTGQFMIAPRDTGTYQLITRRVGFYGGMIGELRLSTRDTFDLIVRMERIAQVLAALQIEGKAAGIDFTRGFEERRRKGLGYFVTPEQIEARGFQRATDLLWGVPGMSVVTDASRPGLAIQRIISTRASGRGGCEPALFVDGMQFDVEDLFRMYSSNDIESIEIYHASGVPARFNMGRSLCGVVLFWTKSRIGRGE